MSEKKPTRESDALDIGIAREAASKAGEVALMYYRDGRTASNAETKDGKTDYVTEADHEAQRTAVETILEHRPDDLIVGEEEETLDEVPDKGRCWVIDPIDGTSNFVRGANLWTTSIALVEDAEPVVAANYVPVTDDMYVAEAETVRNGKNVHVSNVTDTEVFKIVPTVWWSYHRRDEYAEVTRRIVEGFGDMLRFGSAQAVLSMVSAGEIEAAVTNVEVNPWDSIAGVHMVRQAGGTVTDVDGDRWRVGSTGLVASNGKRHKEVLGIVEGL